MAPTAILPEPIADSVDTASFRLGICRAQFYREVQAGRIRVRKLGRRTLVPRSEQEAWLAALPLHVPAPVKGIGSSPLSGMTDDQLQAVVAPSQSTVEAEA